MRAAVWMVLLASACNIPTEPERSGFTELPEDRGAALGATGHLASPALAWSPSGGEVYFGVVKAPGSFGAEGLRGVRLADNSVRELYEGESVVGISPTPDGGVLYVLTRERAAPFRTRLRRLALGDGATPEATQLADSVAPGIYGNLFLGTFPMAALPSGGVVYLAAGHRLTVYADGNARTVNASCAAIAAVSPRGDEVLCGSGGFPHLYTRVSLADGASIPLEGPTSESMSRALQFRWTSSGIRMLYYKALDRYVAALETGTTTRVIADTATRLDHGYAEPRLSADGTKLTYWRWECYRHTAVLACDQQFLLMVLDIATMTARRVAVVKRASSSQSEIGPPSLSPDGSRVVYSVGGTLYMQSVP